ncbi:MAG: hypothetical protein IKM44_01605 [Clostridia bacterium]|nr:hypothetical protein [Clostridia bacterium]
MMKKTIIKRFIAMLICLSLLVFIVAVSMGSKPYVAGAGNGTNAEIKTVSDVKKVIDTIDDINEKVSFNKANPSAPPSAVTGGTESADVYSSFTFKETTALSQSYSSNQSYNNAKSNSSSNISFNRELTLYGTQTAIAYSAKGEITSSAYSHITQDRLTTTIITEESAVQNVSFEMDFYITQTKTFFRVNKWAYDYDYKRIYKYWDNTDHANDEEEETVSGKNSALSIFEKLVGPWWDATNVPEIATALHNVNTQNSSTLKTLGDTIVYAMENPNANCFEKDGDRYDLGKDFLFYALGLTNQYAESTKGSVSFDMSDSVCPSIKMDLTCDHNTASGDNDAYLIYHLYDDMKFSNINNTIIKEVDTEIKDLKAWMIEGDSNV